MGRSFPAAFLTAEVAEVFGLVFSVSEEKLWRELFRSASPSGNFASAEQFVFEGLDRPSGPVFS
jgi:hypothetical protein